MSKRLECPTCLRPMKTCVCHLIESVENKISLVILQHPLEVYEAKNSARLLHLCLRNSQILVGEKFAETISQDDYYDVLLYPETKEETSMGISAPPELCINNIHGENINKFHTIRLWVLDGTWRKSRKMLYLNPFLQTMPRLSLRDCPSSIYDIRKAHTENQLSTLEASCYALRQLEQNQVDYTPVLNAFRGFIAAQKTFLPSTQ